MAFMLGVRVASCCLAGAAVIINRESTKATTQKLYDWLDANKHNLRHPWRWSRPPEPEPEPEPEPDRAVDNEPDDEALVEEPFPVHYRVDSADGAALNCDPRAGPNAPESAATGGDLMGGPPVSAAFVSEPGDAVEEPFPYGPVDSGDGAPVCKPRAGRKAPESAATGSDLMGGPPVSAAFVNDPDDAVEKRPFPDNSVDSGDGAPVREPRAGPKAPESAVMEGDPTAGPPVFAAVKEAGSTVKPDLVPPASAVSFGSVPGSDRPDFDAKQTFGAAAADGIRQGFSLKAAVNAVRTRGTRLLERWFPVDGVCNSKEGAPGDTGWTLDPDFWGKIGRITKRILLWVVEYAILGRATKHNKELRQLWNILKAELW